MRKKNVFVLIASHVSRPSIKIKRYKNMVKQEVTTSYIHSYNLQFTEKTSLTLKNMKYVHLDSETGDQGFADIYGDGRMLRVRKEFVEDSNKWENNVEKFPLCSKTTLNVAVYQGTHFIFGAGQEVLISRLDPDRGIFHMGKVACIFKKTFLSNTHSNSGRNVQIVGSSLFFVIHKNSTLVEVDLRKLFLAPFSRIQSISELQNENAVGYRIIEEMVVEFVATENILITLSETGILKKFTRKDDGYILFNVLNMPNNLNGEKIIFTALGYFERQLIVSGFTRKLRKQKIIHKSMYSDVKGTMEVDTSRVILSIEYCCKNIKMIKKLRRDTLWMLVDLCGEVDLVITNGFEVQAFQKRLFINNS